VSIFRLAPAEPRLYRFILVFLAVMVGAGLGGIVGVIVAVPSLVVLRVLFDFFRVRLATEE
jgi:predicted PurR-regulated permease PerM